MSAAPVRSITREPQAAVQYVTPEQARVWLDANRSNRTLRPQQVGRYVRDMLADRWKMTGEGIKFAVDGRLLDGQHRLAAVVKADKPVQMLVVTDLPTESMDAMDSGVKRSASDALGMLGKTQAANLGSAARLAITVKEVGYDLATRYPVSTPQVLEFVEQNPLIERAVHLSMEHYRRMDVSPVALSYSTFRWLQIDDTATQQFLVAAAFSGGRYDGDPTIALTYRLAEERRQGRRLEVPETLSLLFRAWNDRAANRAVQIYRVRSTSGKGTVAVPALAGETDPKRWVAQPVKS